jgi:SAM-dependent methyltransferase
MQEAESPVWAEHPELVNFYTKHRNRPEDLYPSERRFLPWLAKQTRTVLDIGCAAGGFSRIWQHYQPGIRYVGVDVSASLIAAARSLYPAAEFHEGNCAEGLSFADRSATVVQALGWLHWEERYERALRELWRVCDRYLFFDVRLATEAELAMSGRQQMAFAGAWDGQTTTPYICLAWPLFAGLLLNLRPCTIFGYGYLGRPAETVMGVGPEVCFSTFVLEKGPANDSLPLTTVCLEMPLPWPAALTETAMVVPATKLPTLVPAAENFA